MPFVIAVLTLFAAPTWRTYRIVTGTLFAVLLTGGASAATELAEITIHIRGEYKRVVSVLLAAADEGTPVTGIAELDSLAAAYGLMGIYRKGRSSSFYGYQFRLTFPPGADEGAIAGAYGNISYIRSVEPEPPLVQSAQAEPVDSLSAKAKPMDTYFLDSAITRIPKKVGFGALTTLATTVILTKTIFKPENFYTEGDAIFSAEDEAELISFFFGLVGGYPLGVYLADPVESSCWMTFVGGYGIAVGGLVAADAADAVIGFSKFKIGRGIVGTVAILGGPIMASELSRRLPKRFRNPNPFKWLFGTFRRPSPRVSFDLSPTLTGGFSAVAQLRF